MKSRSVWFENGTEKARKQRNENSKRLIKSAILGNADTKTTTMKDVVAVFAFQWEENTAVERKSTYRKRKADNARARVAPSCDHS